MTTPASNFDPASDAFRLNRKAMLEHLARLDELLAATRAGGGEKYVKRHRERGKLLARERIELLLDRDAPFLELMPFVGADSEYQVGGSVVCGIGVVEGVECILIANDPTVRGGPEPTHLAQDPSRSGDRDGQPPAAGQSRRVGRR